MPANLDTLICIPLGLRTVLDGCLKQGTVSTQTAGLLLWGKRWRRGAWVAHLSMCSACNRRSCFMHAYMYAWMPAVGSQQGCARAAKEGSSGGETNEQSRVANPEGNEPRRSDERGRSGHRETRGVARTFPAPLPYLGGGGSVQACKLCRMVRRRLMYRETSEIARHAHISLPKMSRRKFTIDIGSAHVAAHTLNVSSTP